MIRLVSFNDKESLNADRSDLEIQISQLVNNSKKGSTTIDELLVHCGGYGVSLIAKTKVNDLNACVWMKLEKGQVKVRSIGGLESTKSESCDGYKWNELIVGLKNSNQIDELQNEYFKSFIGSVTVISKNIVKITLRPEHMGSEEKIMSEIKKMIDVKYVELNFFQHPVGEAASLR